jgi:isopenicillin-N epimerase
LPRQEFDYTGLADYSPALTLPAALRFRRQAFGSEQRIMSRNHALAVWAGAFLARAWGTECAAPPHRLAAMALVRLPFALMPTPAARDALHAVLLARFSIEAPVLFLPGWQALWVRVAAQVFNTARDYERLAAAVLQLRAEGWPGPALTANL